MENIEQELLTVEEAAERLGVHVATLRAWVRDRRIPAYRLGKRFTRVDWKEVLGVLSAQPRSDGEDAARDPEPPGTGPRVREAGGERGTLG